MQNNMVDRYARIEQLSEDYLRVERAIRYLEQHYQEQPSLDEVAASVGLSEYHFQRLFARWAGISPKRFLQFLTKEHAKRLLESSSSVLDASYSSGLSSPGRLHDLFVTCEAVTPGEYKSHGEGLAISYGFHPSPFGECMLAITERGLCGMAFCEANDRQKVLRDLQTRWRKATIDEDQERTAGILEQVFPAGTSAAPPDLHLLLNGTNFQIKVWEALLYVPPGKVVSYEEIAVFMGMPKAARAVSRAVAVNPIALIIPCHRVIRKMGAFGGYRWGTARKKAILGWEMAQSAV